MRLTTIIALAWFVVCFTLSCLVLLLDYLRFNADFHETSLTLQHEMQSRIREDVQAIMDKLRETIAQPMHIEGRSISVGVSIGAAYYPEDTADLLDLLHIADKEMYRSKREQGDKAELIRLPT